MHKMTGRQEDISYRPTRTPQNKLYSVQIARITVSISSRIGKMHTVVCLDTMNCFYLF